MMYVYVYTKSLLTRILCGGELQSPYSQGEAAKAPPADFSAEIYTHPSLRPAATGWHPDVGKVWRGYPNVAVKSTF